MPVVISPHDHELGDRLTKSGAVVLTHDEAITQDIRPARVGLLNLMPAPAMETTENQWLRYISNTVLQIEPVLLKFDDDIRERDGASRKDILRRYLPFSEGVRNGLDGLIITGDNLELRKDTDAHEALEFEDITYGSALRDVIEWARDNVFSTIYSCLASHFALNHFYSIDRRIQDQKIFGIFEHDVDFYSKHPLVQGLDDILSAPHSRWGDMSTSDLANAGVDVLASNDICGWLCAASTNNAGGIDVYLQGHPEYDKYDLHSEFLRDWENGQRMPRDYYDSNNPASVPRMTWANDARALHTNWISLIYKHFSGHFSA